MLFHIFAKEEVLSPALFYHVIKAWFINGKMVTIPGNNSRLKNINNHYFNVWALQCNHGHGRPTDIASSNATDLHHIYM
jgi:hypothetical protein